LGGSRDKLGREIHVRLVCCILCAI
jgi:hypothetical protein